MKFEHLNQGDRFNLNNKVYIVVPKFCECYGNSFNCLELLSGTAVNLDANTEVDVVKLLDEEDDIYEKFY